MTTYAYNLNASRSLKLPLAFLSLFFLFILACLSGTSILYTSLLLLFIIFTVLTVRTLGGPTTLFGYTVLYFSFVHVLTAQIMKLILWQPLDSNLLQPTTTMEAYVLAMLGIFLAAGIFKYSQFFKRKPLLDIVTSARDLQMTAIVAGALDLLRILIIALAGNTSVQGGTHESIGMVVLKSLDVLNAFVVVSATAYVVTASDGKKILTWFNGIPLAWTFAIGLVGSYRGAMGFPIIYMLLTAYCFGYKFNRSTYLVIFVLLLLLETVLFPFSYYTRNVVRAEASFQRKAEMTAGLFVDYIQNRERYAHVLEGNDKIQAKWRRHRHYFGDVKPPDFVERFSLMIITDDIVNATVTKGTVGFRFFRKGLLLCLPRQLAPDKPISPVWPGNQLAHRVTAPRIVGKHDFVTGISCGFVSDAFSCFSYLGAFFFALTISLTYFVLYAVLIGPSFKSNIFTLTYILVLPTGFSEGVAISIIVDMFEGCLIGFAALALIVRMAIFIAANTRFLHLRPRGEL